MSINLSEPAVQLRELRLKTITGYSGDAEHLLGCTKTGTLQNRERSFSQCGSCGADQVMNMLLTLQDAAVVEHGPAGCGGDIPFRNGGFRTGNRRLGLDVHNVHYINTNLDEKDVIYGGADKLEKAIREARRRFDPKAIFVTTTCTSAIIGDDVPGICDEMERELGIPVAATLCEGFRTNIWATGFDSASHSILRKIVKPPRKKQEDLINVICFTHRYHYEDVFRQLGLRPNYIVPFSTIGQLEYISEAAATAQYCETLGSYLAAGLEENYGVPEIKAPAPFGIAASDEYLREIGRMFHKEKDVEKVIASEKEKIAPQLEDLRKKLSGKTAFVGAGGPLAYSIMGMLEDFDMKLTGGYIWHHDQRFDNDDPRLDVLSFHVKHFGNFPLGVCNKQSFEVVNALNHYKPDLYISRHMSPAWAIKLGIPGFLHGIEPSEMLYEGLIRYGELIYHTIANPAFAKNIARHSKLPYTDWWFEQDAFTFLGGEADA
ncbi:MAG: nitrogenase [Clostridiales Family XIII bacterium]|nr:nitrogenase [Clostridiales Family XIII bacterium]